MVSWVQYVAFSPQFLVSGSPNSILSAVARYAIAVLGFKPSGMTSGEITTSDPRSSKEARVAGRVDSVRHESLPLRTTICFLAPNIQLTGEGI